MEKLKNIEIDIYDKNFNFADDIDWDSLASEAGKELRGGSIGYNIPTAKTPTPTKADEEFCARCTDGSAIVVSGAGEVWLLSPDEFIENQGTYNQFIFP